MRSWWGVCAVAEVLGSADLRAIARDGLVLPRGRYPGQRWQPQTEAEKHLHGQAEKLERYRLRLLAEIARMQLTENRKREHRAEAEAQAETSGTVPGASLEGLTRRDLEVLAAAAEGETLGETAERLGLATTTIKSRRSAARSRLGAPTFARALVIATEAGLVSAGGVS